jgi:TPR repeat protein
VPQPCPEEGEAFLEQAAEQGHAYAMNTSAHVHDARNEHEQAVGWYTKGAEAGLPKATFGLACCLEQGLGVAAPDYLAAAGWYRRAADAGNGEAAENIAQMYAVGRGRAWQIMPTSSSSFYRFVS